MVGSGQGDTALHIAPGANPDAALGYAVAAVLCFVAPWVATRDESEESNETG